MRRPARLWILKCCGRGSAVGGPAGLVAGYARSSASGALAAGWPVRSDPCLPRRRQNSFACTGVGRFRCFVTISRLLYSRCECQHRTQAFAKASPCSCPQGEIVPRVLAFAQAFLDVADNSFNEQGLHFVCQAFRRQRFWISANVGTGPGTEAHFAGTNRCPWSVAW